MRGFRFLCAALAASMMPGVVMADDPNDPTMSSAAERARDREIIRQLNLAELKRVRVRDARWAQERRAAREVSTAHQREYEARLRAHQARQRAHQADMADYARNRATYERRMAQWRRDVAACHAGDNSACN